jgi:hypothetical protein
VYSLLPPAFVSDSLEINPEPLSWIVFSGSISAFRQQTIRRLREQAGFLQQTSSWFSISQRLVSGSSPSGPILRRSRVRTAATANIVRVIHNSGFRNRPKTRLRLQRMSAMSQSRNLATEGKNEQARCLGSEIVRFALDRHTEALETGGLSIDNCQ